MGSWADSGRAALPRMPLRRQRLRPDAQRPGDAGDQQRDAGQRHRARPFAAPRVVVGQRRQRLEESGKIGDGDGKRGRIGEEAVEAIIAAVKGDREKLVSEASDTLYHLLVMLAARDLTLADVEAELDRREGRSGIAEKAARGKPGA